MKNLLQIGAGNIGLGCIARCFYQQGYTLTFSDVNDSVIDKLNKRKFYTLELVGKYITHETIYIKEAFQINNQEKLNEVFLTSQIITTAVGANNLRDIAKKIANAIKYLYKNHCSVEKIIIACENYMSASSFLKKQVFLYLSEKEKHYTHHYISFIDAAVDCIIPKSENSSIKALRVEDFYEFVVEQPKIMKKYVNPTENFIFTHKVRPYIERKIFALNTTHAALAYIGYYYNKKTIIDVLDDKNIYRFINGMLHTTAKILNGKFRFSLKELQAYNQVILQRFKNPYLIDYPERIGRNILQKISFSERFIQPMLIANALNISSHHYEIALAFAFHYNNMADQDSISLQKYIQTKGFFHTFAFFTDIQYQPITQKIYTYYKKIADEKDDFSWNLLL